MGQNTNYNLEYVQKYYLEQFLKMKYRLIECDAQSTQSISLFDKFFDIENNELDYVEEIDKSIVCQWLIERKDNRFKFFVKYYLEPYNILDLSCFSYEEIFSLISPHNIENTLFS